MEIRTESPGDIGKLLTELGSMEGIENAALVARNGTSIAYDIGSDADIDIFSAMTATLFGAAETAVAELGMNGIRNLSIHTDNTRILLKDAGRSAILVTITNCSGESQRIVDEYAARLQEALRENQESG